ncbi:MAG: hypothetical protein PUD12_07690 [Firmicutes bacterium]|nr:hypothetical protein [Bacillota bacterium]
MSTFNVDLPFRKVCFYGRLYGAFIADDGSLLYNVCVTAEEMRRPGEYMPGSYPVTARRKTEESHG